MKKGLAIAYVVYFALFIFLLFFNLDRLPLVWFDEVLGLDPAIQWVFNHSYSSRIWPQTGTEDHFMAYLPMQFIFHAGHLLILPFEVYWIRLPWAIYFLIAALILFFIAKQHSKNWFIAILVCFIFIHDKTVFEVARSMRVEPISFLFIGLCGLAYYNKKSVLLAIFSTTLVFIHPNLWMLALVLFLSASAQFNGKLSLKGSIKPNWLWLIPLLACIGFLYSISFNLSDLYTQLLEHGRQHTASGSITSRLNAHFIGRFWPYYTTQPWMPLLMLFALIRSLVILAKRKGNALDVALVLTHVYWIGLLAPFYRYNAVLLFISLLSLMPILSKIKQTENLHWISLALLLLMPFNVMARHLTALAQREQRGPKPVIDWISGELAQQGKTLVIGHDVAYYAIALDPSKQYMMFNLSDAKINWASYDSYYAVLTDSLADYSSRIKSRYVVDKEVGLKFLEPYFRHLPNYSKMYLYKIPNESEMKMLMKYLDKQNTSVNRP